MCEQTLFIMIELFRTEQRRLGDLVPHAKNPRKITAVKQRELEEKLGKYGLIGIAVIDADGTIISGKQRTERLVQMGFADKVVDVRVAVRKLTDDELKEVMLIENNHWGEWDAHLLKEEFSQFLPEFDFGIDFAKLDAEVAEMAEQKETPEMPIVAKYSEHYTAFIIVCTNEIDENNVAEMLGIDRQRCYKSTKVGRSHVLPAKQFQEVWKSAKS